MQMTDYSHLVCHFYCNISISFLKSYSFGHGVPQEA